MPKFRYVSDEAERTYPFVVVDEDTTRAYIVSKGDEVYAVENPDPSRFVEVADKRLDRGKATAAPTTAG